MNNTKIMSKEQIGRIIRYGRRAWKLLTQEERDAYTNDVGVATFVKNVASILRVNDYYISFTDLDAVIQMIINYRGR